MSLITEYMYRQQRWLWTRGGDFGNFWTPDCLSKKNFLMKGFFLLWSSVINIYNTINVMMKIIVNGHCMNYCVQSHQMMHTFLCEVKVLVKPAKWWFRCKSTIITGILGGGYKGGVLYSVSKKNFTLTKMLVTYSLSCFHPFCFLCKWANIMTTHSCKNADLWPVIRKWQLLL